MNSTLIICLAPYCIFSFPGMDTEAEEFYDHHTDWDKIPGTALIT